VIGSAALTNIPIDALDSRYIWFMYKLLPWVVQHAFPGWRLCISAHGQNSGCRNEFSGSQLSGAEKLSFAKGGCQSYRLIVLRKFFEEMIPFGTQLEPRLGTAGSVTVGVSFPSDGTKKEGGPLIATQALKPY
jgi:hypothetical protein